MASSFELIAFYSNPKTLDELIKSGIDGVIIDWENKGKMNRQSLYNTQVNEHRSKELIIAREKNISNIICRINGPQYWSVDEIEKAIDLGANELLVPMIKCQKEVEFILNQVRGRIDVGVMIETNEALLIADELDKMPIHRFFVGLNDLSIQRKSRNIFLPFVDGTIDILRPKITKRFGVAGLTHPSAGTPIPCKYLIHQMKKHRASFGFLRRAFYKDLSIYTAEEIINSLRAVFDTPVIEELEDLTIEEQCFLNQELI